MCARRLQMFACPATLAEEFKAAGLTDLVSEVTPQRVRSKLRQVYVPPFSASSYPPPLPLPLLSYLVLVTHYLLRATFFFFAANM
jgi:hypothetical protein